MSNQPATAGAANLNTLKRWVILLLVVLQAATVVSILFFSGLASQSALLRQAQKILNGATHESIGHTEVFLDHAYREVSLASDLFDSGVLDAGNLAAVENYFLSKLRHNAAFAGMYLGTESGEFFYVSRDQTGGDDRYRVKHVRAMGNDANTALWWREAGSTYQVDLTHDATDKFDARTRPWYREAKSNNRFVWTDPYIFFTAQQLGITAAGPMYNPNGKMIGVIGIDVELQKLAGFLADLNISATGSAFITNSEGLLIATPALAEQPVRDLAALSISAMADPVGRQVLEKIHAASQSTDKSSSRFVAGKTHYIFDSMPLQLADGEQWLIATYAARDDFLADIRESERASLFLAVGIMLIAVLIGTLLATTAWTPLEMLHFQANRDQLTQIHNRHYLMKHGKRLFAEARRDGENLAAAIIDIDHFKKINDHYGHAAGDAVIKAIAHRLTEVSRNHDLVARFGGEEFVVLLPTADAEIAKSVLQRSRVDLMENPVEYGDERIAITFSAGICEIGATSYTLEQALNVADKALYQAKSMGRNRTIVAKQPADISQAPPRGIAAPICP